ncbi:hypothetical protein [Bowmanella dokdonensis]|uniref:Uncharacterized protein n=1 Tax=Bowmanella dokdonensis TaxID=751969 RepID=A0A939ITC1_9ALTE|nr:hypothetical protein [Bowmanella dokdonensis]MBN7827311.1 hypothetical protein [Bowmanella dokdonensis]
MSLRISDFREFTQADRRIISALVDGDEVFFSFPDWVSLRTPGDAFIGICLLDAMATGRNIVLDETVPFSTSIQNTVAELQPLYSMWNRGLKRVEVLGEAQEAGVATPGAASFYSGGIDGSYSLARHFDAITHLITMNGFEGWDKEEQWEVFLNRQIRFAQSQGKRLIDVLGNYRQYAENRKISHNFQHGLELGAVAAILGFPATYIPSSFTCDDLFPWGSHPLTDPLWGDATRKVIHDGMDVSRTDKTEYLAAHQALLDNLQVCWRHVDSNCGECSKCMRTMIALKLLNMHAASLPPLQSLQQAKSMAVKSHAAVPFALDLAYLARRQGQEELASALENKVRRFNIRMHWEALFNLLTHSIFKRLVHKWRGTEWVSWRVTMTQTNIR